MNNQLRIASLSVENYRCFERMDTPVVFHSDLTVLVARNGEGKTAILDAIKIALGTFTSSFPITSQAHFHISDVHIAALQEQCFLGAVYPVSLKATGTINDRAENWSRSLQKAKGRTTTKDAKVVSSFGEMLYKEIQKKDSNVSLPLIAFYGTGRLWAEHKDMNDGGISPLAQSRFAGYENALSARSTYKQVKNWLLEALKMEDSKQASITQAGQFVQSQLEAIEKALQCVLGVEGWGQMHYNSFYRDEITVVNNDKNINGNLILNHDAATALPVSWLSDGIRAVFSMVADIAYRCAKLNPHLGDRACEETCGIVLIDEVDIFLHPAWQQHVLLDLRKAFPNIQFIVTTHSPQVVSSVSDECIRIIENGKIYSVNGTEGAEADRILDRVFGVSAEKSPNPVTQMLLQYMKLVYADKWDSEEAIALRKELEEKFKGDEPRLMEADLYIENRKWEMEDEKNTI